MFYSFKYIFVDHLPSRHPQKCLGKYKASVEEYG